MGIKPNFFLKKSLIVYLNAKCKKISFDYYNLWGVFE